MKLSTAGAAESSGTAGIRRQTARVGEDDPRVIAFGDMLIAADSGDARGVLAAARRLRVLDISVVFLSPRGQGGRR
jgi:hypothetical protein